MENRKYSDLSRLILAMIYEGITAEQFAELQNMLIADSDARKYYVEFMIIHNSLCEPENTIEFNNQLEGFLDIHNEQELWEALAENEKSAAGVKIERNLKQNDQQFQQQFGQRRKVVKRRHTVSRLAVSTAISSLAALLLMIIYLFTHPYQPDAEPVAQLTEVFDAQWGGVEIAPNVKDDLFSGPMSLSAGYAKITFYDGAEIVIQAPCEIELEDSNQMFLKSGTLSSKVPESAIGFVVRTSGATIVDYGTEFGVTAHSSGQTEAHVFKGQVELRTGSDIVRHGNSKRLVCGQAGLVDNNGDLLFENLRANPERFTREIPNQETFGQPAKLLDLADIIGGGNGFGTGRDNVGIDPISGDCTRKLTRSDSTYGNGRYISVSENPFIDGVFVPDSSIGPVQVTSAGHIFTDCPDTNGRYWSQINNTGLVGATEGPLHKSRLCGKNYGTRRNPAILMHANSGITFDLDEIRGAVPGSRISHFTSICGISETVYDSLKSDFYVLVDGQIRFKLEKVQMAGKSSDIDIEINDNDRFLTLIATDGGDHSHYDWCLYGKPALKLENKYITDNYKIK